MRRFEETATDGDVPERGRSQAKVEYLWGVQAGAREEIKTSMECRSPVRHTAQRDNKGTQQTLSPYQDTPLVLARLIGLEDLRHPSSTVMSSGNTLQETLWWFNIQFTMLTTSDHPSGLVVTSLLFPVLKLEVAENDTISLDCAKAPIPGSDEATGVGLYL